MNTSWALPILLVLIVALWVWERIETKGGGR